jgi:hypothetical protein
LGKKGGNNSDNKEMIEKSIRNEIRKIILGMK